MRWGPKLAALDANLLVALDALLQDGGVTRAAHRVGITQSAMSQRLARLREQFDDPILVRAGRGMVPSPFAKRIQRRLRDACGALEAVVRDRPAFDPATARRRFVLATVDYLAMVVLPRLQGFVARAAPGVELAVRALEAGSVASELESGTSDLYLGVHGATERGLEARSVLRDPFVVVTRSGHPLADPAATVQDYVRWPHVHVSPRREGGSVVDRALADLGLDRRVAVEVPFFGLVPGLLGGSDLVATVPESIGRLFARQHGLSVLPPPVPLASAEICVAWHPTFDRDAGLRWLREAVVAIAREERPAIIPRAEAAERPDRSR
ncbi:MAG: LysR family transcriptional regulator [Deltaproteobacteria bacterium HGW-Deltaproteobacteria-14]|jgi:DNA-binding transcriptional LysR family regulator|nr:MAG: LysR family transcriptional regulator [Deltaproteobacteria bacterium HGW-Deltaproteobacteria-14]